VRLFFTAARTYAVLRLRCTRKWICASAGSPATESGRPVGVEGLGVDTLKIGVVVEEGGDVFHRRLALFLYQRYSKK
jgi:hypothetical protein